jgi:hypothetical protein
MTENKDSKKQEKFERRLKEHEIDTEIMEEVYTEQADEDEKLYGKQTNPKYKEVYEKLNNKFDSIHDLIIKDRIRYWYFIGYIPVIAFNVVGVWFLIHDGIKSAMFEIIALVGACILTASFCTNWFPQKRYPKTYYLLRIERQMHYFYFDSRQLFRYFDGKNYIEVHRRSFAKKYKDPFYTVKTGKSTFYKFCGSYQYNVPVCSYIKSVRCRHNKIIIRGENKRFNMSFCLTAGADYTPKRLCTNAGYTYRTTENMFFFKTNNNTSKIYAPAKLLEAFKRNKITPPQSDRIVYIEENTDLWAYLKRNQLEI